MIIIIKVLTAKFEGQATSKWVRTKGARPKRKVVKGLPRLRARFSWSVHRHLNRLVVGANLRRRRGHYNRERETFACKENQLIIR